MYVINALNPDHALSSLLNILESEGISSSSRNGTVLRAAAPVMTVWEPHVSRVSFWPTRNANPFFHLMEAMWMLAGRNDLGFVSHYAATMKQFSDDGGVTQPGAYGHRWRRHFGYDQLRNVVNDLRDDPFSRRVVLTMWDANKDLPANKMSKDVPCNTHIYFDFVSGQLNMTVCCRSNDAVWGAYGSNVVHFSLLHEFVCGAAGLVRGRLYQMSNNMHVYSDRDDVMRLRVALPDASGRESFHSALLAPGETSTFWPALDRLMNYSTVDPNAAMPAFFANVLWPMKLAYAAHKLGETEIAIAHIKRSRNEWLVAGCEWLERRLAAKQAQQEKQA